MTPWFSVLVPKKTVTPSWQYQASHRLMSGDVCASAGVCMKQPEEAQPRGTSAPYATVEEQPLKVQGSLPCMEEAQVFPSKQGEMLCSRIA